MRTLKPAYECLSDGTSASGVVWTTGRELGSRWSVSAGGTWSAFPWLMLYTGAGFGSRKIYWEDSASQWALVSDLSRKGLSLDAGAVFSAGVLSFMTGVSWVGRGTLCAELGIGLSF